MSDLPRPNPAAFDWPRGHHPDGDEAWLVAYSLTYWLT